MREGDHAAYCASWVPLLRAKPRALSHAAAQASRAADYLAALQPGDSTRPGIEVETEAPHPRPAALVAAVTEPASAA